MRVCRGSEIDFCLNSYRVSLTSGQEIQRCTQQLATHESTIRIKDISDRSVFYYIHLILYNYIYSIDT
jgi:hypothetical protein